jgi:hypothetical protein
MDLFEIRLQEEIEFWQNQIEMAEKAQDENALPRLRDALKLVEFKLARYRGPSRSTMTN